jgi:hypothetical protein
VAAVVHCQWVVAPSTARHHHRESLPHNHCNMILQAVLAYP